MLDLAAASAVCGTFKVLGTDIAPAALRWLFELLFWLGALAFLGVLVLGFSFYLKHRSEFSLGRTACFFTLVLFFLPMFLSHDINVAFFSYAIAHGTQYLAFMAMLSLDLGREGRRAVSKRMLVVGASLVLVGLAGARAADLKALAPIEASVILTSVLDFLAGIGLGTTLAHFVVDAGAWKLSQPAARRYVRDRFAFLFEPAPTRAHGAASRAFSR